MKMEKEKKVLYKKLKEIREHLEKTLNYVKEEERQAYTRTPFQCSFCKKDIDLKERFVLVDVWDDMDSWYNDVVASDVKVYHIKCYKAKR